jgi:hypothetical protein
MNGIQLQDAPDRVQIETSARVARLRVTLSLARVQYNRLPDMTCVCKNRHARHFPDETESMCSLNGKVRVPLPAPLPSLYVDLFDNPDFLKTIRVYNQVGV